MPRPFSHVDRNSSGPGARSQVQVSLSAARNLVHASHEGPHDAPVRNNTCSCGPLVNPTTVGPLIRFTGYDTSSGAWRASVLYGTTCSESKLGSYKSDDVDAQAPPPPGAMGIGTGPGGHMLQTHGGGGGHGAPGPEVGRLLAAAGLWQAPAPEGLDPSRPLAAGMSAPPGHGHRGGRVRHPEAPTLNYRVHVAGDKYEGRAGATAMTGFESGGSAAGRDMSPASAGEAGAEAGRSGAEREGLYPPVPSARHDEVGSQGAAGEQGYGSGGAGSYVPTDPQGYYQQERRQQEQQRAAGQVMDVEPLLLATYRYTSAGAGRAAGEGAPEGGQLMAFWRYDLEVGVLRDEAQWLEYWIEPDGCEGGDRGGVRNGSMQGKKQQQSPAVGPAMGGDSSGGEFGGEGAGALAGQQGGWGQGHGLGWGPLRVFIPAAEGSWRWAFHSCAGFSMDVEPKVVSDSYCGYAPLWGDLLSRHAAQPLCALVGGGDQLYNDDVWQVPALKRWLDITDLEERLRQPFTADQAQQVLSYYMHHYAVHFMAAPASRAFATIPQVNTWDDHDIFDGWGSYPVELQSCDVFRGIYECARAAYLLFQHHTTPRRAPHDALLVTPQGGLHRLVALGPRQLLLLPDQRGERTRYQVLPLESYAELFALLARPPPSLRHLVVVCTVPLVYPHIIGSHKLATCFRGLNRSRFMRPIMAKTGISSAIMNRFGEPELLDDLRDHWVAPGHLGERRFLIEHLQMAAKSRSCRVSIISGDVHLCGASELHTWPIKPWRPPANDWRYMQQVISSAIANPPPPTGLVRVLEACGRAGLTNRRTRNKMQLTFRDHPGRRVLLNMRNWCEVEEEVKSGNLTFTLRVEQPHPPAPPAPPAGPLPALQQQQQQAGQAQQQQQQRGHAEVQLPASTRSADAPITPHVIELRSGMTLPRESTAAGQGTAVGAAGTAGAAAGQGTVVSTAGTAGATAGQRQEKPGLARRLCGWMLPGGAKGQEGELVGDGDTVHVDILPYKIVVPPLEVRQPPPGSKEHELYAGQDF